MERIALPELRNQASRVVRRAKAGERLIITVDSVRAAEIGPVVPTEQVLRLDGLIAAGAVLPPRTRTAPPPAVPLRAPGGEGTGDVLRHLPDR